MAKKASGAKAATKKPAAKKPAAKKTTAKKTTAKKTTVKKTAVRKPAVKKVAVKAVAVKAAAVKKAPAAKAAPAKKAGKRKVDALCPLNGSAEVHEDFDAMLNQTNINANNNKFYVIQLLSNGGKYHVWNRWGRVSENGQSALKGPYDLAGAIKEFEAKFKSKTSNKWADRASFVAKKGKYTLIEIEASDDDEVEELDQKLRDLDKKRGKVEEPQKFKDCGLDKPLQSFIDLIFDHDMFKGAMADFDIDVKKMPLGKLSQTQIQKGFDVLEELQQALDKSRTSSIINELSSRFYTVIPHAFGRRIPPPIDTGEKLQSKMDMLNVLSDIDVALGMQKQTTASKASAALAEHPLDRNYRELKCRLSWLDPKSDMYTIILNYLEATRGSWAKHSIIDVFEVDRDGTDDRFKAHDDLENRRLLWHGTSVAVVAAILKSGLRIMPHSGGRVGKGIYLASEQSKSAGYVGRSRNTGIMFLAEAALGKEHHIHRDDWRLKAAPKGYHSIIAKGHTEPDPKKDIKIKLGGREVVVPQGKPIKQKQWSKSSFTQSEYLVYQESQVRLRYVLKMRM